MKLKYIQTHFSIGSVESVFCIYRTKLFVEEPVYDGHLKSVYMF